MWSPKRVIMELRELGTEIQRAQVIHVASPLLQEAVRHIELTISSLHGFMATPAYAELAKDVVNKALRRESQETMFSDGRDEIEKEVGKRILGQKSGIAEPKEGNNG